MHKFDHIPADKKRIVGVGNALVDILAYEDEDFLNKTGGAKGGMTYVKKEFIEQTIEITSKQPTTVPGGLPVTPLSGWAISAARLVLSANAATGSWVSFLKRI